MKKNNNDYFDLEEVASRFLTEKGREFISVFEVEELLSSFEVPDDDLPLLMEVSEGYFDLILLYVFKYKEIGRIAISYLEEFSKDLVSVLVTRIDMPNYIAEKKYFRKFNIYLESNEQKPPFFCREEDILKYDTNAELKCSVKDSLKYFYKFLEIYKSELKITYKMTKRLLIKYDFFYLPISVINIFLSKTQGKIELFSILSTFKISNQLMILYRLGERKLYVEKYVKYDEIISKSLHGELFKIMSESFENNEKLYEYFLTLSLNDNSFLKYNIYRVILESKMKKMNLADFKVMIKLGCNLRSLNEGKYYLDLISGILNYSNNQKQIKEAIGFFRKIGDYLTENTFKHYFDRYEELEYKGNKYNNKKIIPYIWKQYKIPNKMAYSANIEIKICIIGKFRILVNGLNIASNLKSHPVLKLYVAVVLLLNKDIKREEFVEKFWGKGKDVNLRVQMGKLKKILEEFQIDDLIILKGNKIYISDRFKVSCDYNQIKKSFEEGKKLFYCNEYIKAYSVFQKISNRLKSGLSINPSGNPCYTILVLKYKKLRIRTLELKALCECRNKDWQKFNESMKEMIIIDEKFARKYLISIKKIGFKENILNSANQYLINRGDSLEMTLKKIILMEYS